MNPRQKHVVPRVVVHRLDGVDALVAAHVRDRLATLDLYADAPLRDVCAVVRVLTVEAYGDLVQVEASADTSTGRVQARAQAASVFVAVDKVRDRLCLRLAGQGLAGARTARPRGPETRLPRTRWWSWWPSRRRRHSPPPRPGGTAAAPDERTTP